jgi:hypothetical protein
VESGYLAHMRPAVLYLLTILDLSSYGRGEKRLMVAAAWWLGKRSCDHLS